MNTECCGKNAEAVKWNSYNKVVQCHHCGHTYKPEVYGKLSERK